MIAYLFLFKINSRDFDRTGPVLHPVPIVVLDIRCNLIEMVA
jgi:hypothetical protein